MTVNSRLKKGCVNVRHLNPSGLDHTGGIFNTLFTIIFYKEINSDSLSIISVKITLKLQEFWLRLEY